MSTIDIRTGKQTEVNTIIFRDAPSCYDADAISFVNGEVEFFNSEEKDEIAMTLSLSEAYNLHLSLVKAVELGLLKAPTAPAKKAAAKKK